MPLDYGCSIYPRKVPQISTLPGAEPVRIDIPRFERGHPMPGSSGERVGELRSSRRTQPMLDVPQEQRYLRAETASRNLPRFASPPYDGTTETAQLAREVTRTEASERFLPKPAIEQFDGDPLDYWAFVSRFKVHIADRISSDDLKLVYLLQHCSKSVYERVKHYAGGPDKRQCYQKVWRELYDRYGQPHVVGRHCEQRLLDLPKVGQYDAEHLESMAILMKRFLASLDELSGSTTMNTVGFISTLVEKLPVELRRKWVSKALKIQNKTGSLAGFADLAEFVISESAEANSTYYKAIFPLRSSKSNGHVFKQRKAHTFTTTTPVKTSDQASNQAKDKGSNEGKQSLQNAPMNCYCCGERHKLSQCNEFAAKSYQERRSVVREKKLCYRCLRQGHSIKDCRSRRACDVESCKSNSHHTLLHSEQIGAGNSNSMVPVRNAVLLNGDSLRGLKGGASLDILPVRVSNGDEEVLTYALLDPGSSMSFCEQVLINQLGIKDQGSVVETFMETLTTKRPEPLKSVCFSVDVKPVDSNGGIKISNVVMIDHIPVNPLCRNVIPNLDEFEHLRDVTLPEIKGASVTLLIGNDNYLAHFPLETRVADDPGSAGPHAIKTPLGWVLKGSTSSLAGTVPAKCHNFLLNQGHTPACLEELNGVLVTDEGETINPSPCINSWDVDSLMSWLKSNQEAREFGMKYSAEDVVAYDRMERSISFDEGHFELPLLWKNTSVRLPESLNMARKRLEGVKRRLLRDDNMKEMYRKQMETVLSRDYAEEVRMNEWDARKRIWYVPHHPVVNPNKPGKVRIVYDCAAKSHGVSLNEELMKGPDLVNRLVGVLLRFRKDKVAIAADIESMFYQVRCAPEDRDSLRFLWWPGGDLAKEAVPHRMKVHLFGAKSSPSCAAFALLEIARRFGKYFPTNVSDVIRKGFYVDNCLTTASNDEEGIQLIKNLREMLGKGGFHLTKWISNSQEVIESVEPDERAKVVAKVDIGDASTERVLGMRWNVQTDHFEFNVRIPEKPFTRRGLLGITNALFDPLGLVSPVVLEARLLFRSLCQMKVGWDDKVPDSDAAKWKKWKDSLVALNDLKIERWCKGPKGATDLQLHAFADASTVARGSVCYLRYIDSDQQIRCSLLMAKSLLAGSENQTVPRLELEAALDAVKLAKVVQSELELEKCPCVYWTDSTIVLHSLRAETKKFPVFSRNRLSQIERLTCVYDWHHVPSSLNPADLASRGCSATALVSSPVWLNGPEFLRKSHEEWPQLPLMRKSDENSCKAFDVPRNNAPTLSMMVTVEKFKPTPMEYFVNYWSSWYRLRVAASGLLRFKSFLLSRIKGVGLEKLICGPITVEELQCAEKELLKYVQHCSFPEWFSGRRVPLKSNVLYQLNPIVLDGILRVGGRLAKANLPLTVKHPAILPSKNHVTDLIIQHCHVQESGHQGVNATLNNLMKRYWIPSPKAAVAKVIKQCLSCKRRTARPKTQIMADLPPARLKMFESPFAHTGVDYFGPFVVKQRRSDVKRYGCIFTCMTTRAVHLEVAPDLTTSAFINALQRFVARRGPVHHVYSDNGSNFIGAEKVLRQSIQSWNQRQIYQHLRQEGIQWTFNPPGASHMGGAWERMIRLVRQIFVSLLSGKRLDDDGLHTLLLEVESIINSRPLTNCSGDPEDPLPFTPNHLLKVDPSVGLPPTLTALSDVFARERYRVVQYVADEFWRRWVEEYPKTMFPRRKWNERRVNLGLGDIVLLVDSFTPRGQWPLRRVVKLYPDSEEVVRIVDVKTTSGILKRPITKLCVIVKAREKEGNHEDNPADEDDKPNG